MRKYIIMLSSLFAVFCLAPGVMTAEAKEKPVAGVWEMFDTFQEFEEQVRSDKWSEATESLKKFDSEYKKLLVTLKTGVDAKLLQKFSFLLQSLQKKVEGKDAEEVEKPYALMQGLFLDIMESYDYPQPPVLMVSARYVDEAKAGLAAGELEEVSEEMEEIISFKPRIIEAMKAKGVADADGFVAKVESAADAAKAGKKDEAAKLLAELEAVVAPFKAQ